METTTDLATTILNSIRQDLSGLRDKVTHLEGMVTSIDARCTELALAVGDGLDTQHDELPVGDELDAMHDELRGAVTRLDTRIDRLSTRLIEGSVRATAGHHETQQCLIRLMAFVDAQGDLEDRVERCELDVSDLKQRAL